MLRDGRLFRIYSEHQIAVVDADWPVYYAKVYEGCYIPPLKVRLTIEQIKAKDLARKDSEALSPRPGGILDDIACTTKEFLIRVGKIQLLQELLGERGK